jgi:O-antigen ligase
VGFGFTIPVWTLADGVLIGVLIPAWLCTGDWTGKLRRVRDSSVALSALVLIGMLALGTLWGMGGIEDRAVAFKKYSELLFVPLLISMGISAETKNRALMAFCASVAVTLILSLCLAAGLLPVMGLVKGVQGNPFCPFKKHTTHNVLMAFGSMLFAVQAWRAQECRWRWIWGGLAVLAAANVVLMVQGRTGYVVIAALGMALLYRAYRWKGIPVAIGLVAGIGAGAYGVSPVFQQGAELVVEGFQQWSPEKRAVDPVGERVEFYYHTLDIIRAHPIVGVGTGGFSEAYAEQVRGTQFPVTRHPHNQYLLIAAQLGVVGLVLMLWLFAQQWRSSFTLENHVHGFLIRGLVLTIAVGCLFNTFLIDHTEKLWFAWLSGLLFSPSASRQEVAA